MASSAPWRRHVRSWRKPIPHSKAHPLVNRLNLALAPLLLVLPVYRRKLLDPDQGGHSTAAKSGAWQRPISNIEVAAIATVVLSVVVLAVVLLSPW